MQSSFQKNPTTRLVRSNYRTVASRSPAVSFLRQHNYNAHHPDSGDCPDRAFFQHYSGEPMQKFIIAVIVAFFTANAAFAADDCAAKAAEKKLAGAAKNSFIKKCEKDAAAAK